MKNNIFQDTMNSISNIAPPFGGQEVIADVGKFTTAQKTMFKTFAIGTALFFVGRWAIMKFTDSDIRYKRY